jgi:hypothetical protein
MFLLTYYSKVCYDPGIDLLFLKTELAIFQPIATPPHPTILISSTSMKGVEVRKKPAQVSPTTTEVVQHKWL